jgi:3-methyl-2-oxobutanoate hydroxymethyltransferase
MIVVCQAVRRGVRRALLSCDFPFGPVQEGSKTAVRAAIRFVKEAGVDMVKLDGASDHLDAVSAVTRAGIPVFAQFGITPQTSLKYSAAYSATPSAGDAVPEELLDEMVGEAKRLEDAGAALLNFTNSGPVVGPAVAQAVSIPVVGGFGGGPWLDGRMRMATAAIGYSADGLDNPPDTYANVAQIALDAITAYADDVRSARQIAGGIRQ